jgi:hypothetical protein
MTGSTVQRRGRPRSSALPDAVVDLRDRGRLRHTQIAEILDIAENTSRAYYSRRRRELAEQRPNSPLPKRPAIEGAIS